MRRLYHTQRRKGNAYYSVFANVNIPFPLTPPKTAGGKAESHYIQMRAEFNAMHLDNG